jgi:hypothetical protein
MGVLYSSYLTNVVATPIWGVDSVSPEATSQEGAQRRGYSAHLCEMDPGRFDSAEKTVSVWICLN